jgi:ATP-dependent Clp protease ATP-binding subunit ClpA
VREAGRLNLVHTSCAVRALRRAVAAAREYEQGYVGPAHLCFGLIETNGGGLDSLAGMGADPARTHAEIVTRGAFPKERRTLGVAGLLLEARRRGYPERLDEKWMREWHDATYRVVRFTAKAKAVMTAAREEASTLGHEYVGTEHLLLGLLRVGDPVAARVLREAGARLAGARDRVRGLSRPENGWEERSR